MKKHLPNILLILVVLANVFFMARYIGNNGLGMFLRTTGIVFLLLGIVIFIFFLSIDPGYGWTKSIDLTKNYIMIFTSMGVGMAGVVLIVIGQQLNELHVQSISQNKRCQQLAAGKAAEVLQKDWYSLRDQKSRQQLSVYLFQKKSDRTNYRIIAVMQGADAGSTGTVKDLTIASPTIPQPITVTRNDAVCPGVFEQDISIDFFRHQKLNEHVQFDLSLSVAEETSPERSGTEKKIVFNLKSDPPETGLQPGAPIAAPGAGRAL